MDVVGLVGGIAGLCLAAVAVLGLRRAAIRQAGLARGACWWFAAAAGCAFANLAVGQAALFPPGSAAMVASFADLPGFLALPAMAAGLGQLAVAGPGRAGETPPPRRWRRGLATQAAYLVDGYLLAAALLLVGWAVVFGPLFTRYGDVPGTFAAELVHPVADLVFLALTLAAAGAAGRRGVLPYLALAAMAVADSLSVGARITGSPPGVAAVTAQMVALGLLALAPWDWRTRPRAARASGVPWVTAAAAALAAAAAAALVTVQAIVVGRLPEPVVLIVLGVTAVALGARVVGLARRVSSWAQVWQQSGRLFRQLADRTSDVVLICDLDGVIRFASRAVADYGYTPESLAGVALADLLHPEDRPGGIRAVRAAATGTGQPAGAYSCRVRAADGTWRHVESTVSGYRDPSGPDQLLVTAHDISAQVELRRQITHLTFHDVLTGLPNRTYLERRTLEALGPGEPAAPAAAAPTAAAPAAAVPVAAAPAAAATAPGAPLAMAMVVGVDGFAALAGSAGRGAADLLLAQIARRLRLTVPPQATVARWGTTEFAVLIEGVPAAAPGAAGGADVDVAERLARSVPSQPFQLGSEDVTVTVSVGVAVADGGPAARLWDNAEQAMAQARELGGDRVEVFHGPPVGGPAPGGPPEAAAAGAAT